MGNKYTHGSRKQKRQKLILLVIGLSVVICGVIAVALVVNLHHPAQRQPTKLKQVRISPSVKQVNTNYGLPVRLQIPKLQADAHVIYVGLTKDGNMSVPSNVKDTGWYKYGALPGNTGTAVIAGHLDGLRGEPGVFSELNKLVAGDVVTVTENNGLTVSFTVRAKRSYPQNDQPVEVFKSTSGTHLNFITCTGSWDSSEHRFAKRLVVFTDKT